MTEQDSPTTSTSTSTSTSADTSMTHFDRPDAEVVDELMDQVAALLQSQMQAANTHLRRRAARLLDPSRTGADRDEPDE